MRCEEISPTTQKTNNSPMLSQDTFIIMYRPYNPQPLPTPSTSTPIITMNDVG